MIEEYDYRSSDSLAVGIFDFCLNADNAQLIMWIDTTHTHTQTLERIKRKIAACCNKPANCSWHRHTKKKHSNCYIKGDSLWGPIYTWIFFFWNFLKARRLYFVGFMCVRVRACAFQTHWIWSAFTKRTDKPFQISTISLPLLLYVCLLETDQKKPRRCFSVFVAAELFLQPFNNYVFFSRRLKRSLKEKWARL